MFDGLRKIREPDNGRTAQLTELMGMVDSAIDIIMEGELTFNQALNLLGEIEETTQNNLPEVVGDYLQIFESRLKPLLIRYTVKELSPEPQMEKSASVENEKEGISARDLPHG
ncbi:hypothetical protein ACFLT7_04575 [candidate division KSB1 bacterium]